jgi:glycosyltransferase involved in cell wall biosynthesis
LTRSPAQKAQKLSFPGVDRPPSSDSDPGRHDREAFVISIIVPTRNRPVLLTRALECIQSQTFGSFEVIVIDDGSSASTRAGYAALWEGLDDRFHLHLLGTPDGPAVGPSVSRNTGIEAARGEILTFCDDDDFWTSNEHLASMADVFTADSRVDLYIANQNAVAASGVVERADWLPALMQQVSKRTRSHPLGHVIDLDQLIASGGFAQLNIVALRKATATAVGGFWTRTTYEEDRDFFWRVADAARTIFFNPAVVAQHNVPDPTRQTNLSRSVSPAERWLLSVLVSQHITMSVRSAAIRRLCQSYEGDILRHLSRYWSNEGRHELALHYARRALAARASLKWALYTAALAGRHLMRGRTA